MGHLGEKKAYQIYKLLFARSLTACGGGIAAQIIPYPQVPPLAVEPC